MLEEEEGVSREERRRERRNGKRGGERERGKKGGINLARVPCLAFPKRRGKTHRGKERERDCLLLLCFFLPSTRLSLSSHASSLFPPGPALPPTLFFSYVIEESRPSSSFLTRRGGGGQRRRGGGGRPAVRQRPLHGGQAVLGLVQRPRAGRRRRLSLLLLFHRHRCSSWQAAAVLLLLLGKVPGGMGVLLLLLQTLGLVVDSVL